MKNKLQFEDVMIFKHDYNGRSAYSLGISSKKYDAVNRCQLDEWVSLYINIQFPKGNAPEDKQHIDIKDAWLTCYEDKNGVAQPKLIVNKWAPHGDKKDDYPYDDADDDYPF